MTGAEISNADRAGRAAPAVTACARQPRHWPAEQTIKSEEHGDGLIGDLICDLLHLGDQGGLDPEALIQAGRGHYADQAAAERLGNQNAGVEL